MKSQCLAVLFCLTICASLMAAPQASPAQANPRLPFNPDTLPERPDRKTPRGQRIVVLADANSSYGDDTYRKDVHQLIKIIATELKPDIVISAGDLIAAQKKGFKEPLLRKMWAGFDRAITKPLDEAGIPFAPTPGNHDASGYPAFKIDRDIFRDHWNNPKHKPDLNLVGSLNNFPTYYAHSLGKTLFLSLNITTMEPLSDTQWAFIEQTLADHADQYDNIFATSHVPPYPITHKREKQTMTRADAKRINKLFAKYRVDAFFTGHHHGYYKARKNNLNLVSLNACGNGPRLLIGTKAPQKQSIVVIDIENGKITQCFAIKSDNTVFDDKTLPLKLVYEDITLHRFDQAEADKK
ncbi:metallophosphoesterase family protein [Poriferisphaera sp. WC338]|uniref:metallophosphoesterase family protein n=1 Tax=Poriferisphaera sp. WC338 TaxID=3425129 RepID=UPI003D81719D